MYTKQTMIQNFNDPITNLIIIIINFMIISGITIIDKLVLIIYDFLLYSNLYLLHHILFMCVND